MKNKVVYFMGILLLGCSNPVDDLEIGEPFAQSAAIVDQWDLVRVRHVDNLDLNKPFTDLTDMFTTSVASLELTESSFSYSQGSGPNFLEASGAWAFDDDQYPTFLVLNSNTQLRLGEPIRSSDETLTLILERLCEDKVISSYEYLFVRK